MQNFLAFVLTGLVALSRCTAGETSDESPADTAQWRRIYERLEKLGFTNAEHMLTSGPPLLQQFIVHPAFGIYWDEVPAPTLTNSSAMAAVNAFAATNGWNMYTGKSAPIDFFESTKPIRGLPWKEVQNREFPALTYNGILYVMFRGFHFNASGVAYNPRTNAFPGWIAGFKPLNGHWYVWGMADQPLTLPRIYEGSTNNPELRGAANQSQSLLHDTNQPPARGSGR